jgi:hypothetical protein
MPGLPGLLLAQSTSDNAPEGAYFTLWFPLGLFIIVIAILWVRYALPHRRVPPRRPAHARADAGPVFGQSPASERVAPERAPGFTASTPVAGERPDDGVEPGAKGARTDDGEAGE